MNIQNIFENEPTRWGLRGDPYLWKELKNNISKKQEFATSEDFLNFLMSAVEGLIGQKLIEGQYPYVKRFDHGGMSTGRISGEFWLNTAFPLLIHRFNIINNNGK